MNEKWAVNVESTRSGVRVYKRIVVGRVREMEGQIVHPPSKRQRKKGITFKQKIDREVARQQAEVDKWNRLAEIADRYD